MARSRARQVTGNLAELTGRTDDELRLALTVGAMAAALFAALKFLDLLASLGARFRSG